MNRGDVVRVQLPKPVGQPGSEQYGVRPAIVIQADRVTAGLRTVMIVPMTSQLAAVRFPGTFCILPEPSNGLTVESAVLTSQLRAIDRGRIQDVIGTLSPGDMATLEKEIRRLLAL
ncbi:MAG TPA: PemK family transcriptional regulator [Planctomycetaceae bacterium]|nr:PemK family transcriptional regulator [Planctomycetaceae bacterium]